MTSLKTVLGPFNFINPICNASGVYSRTINELSTMFLSNSGAIITKSCSLHERKGNPTPAYWENDKISINSMGLPNFGYRYYCDFIEKIDHYNKKCFLSIANLNNNDTIEIVKYIKDKDYISYPEINVSCPNIIGKEQLAYNLPYLEYFLDDVMEQHYGKPYGLKLPPFFDPVHIAKITNLIGHYPNIKYLTCVNSIGNALDIDLNTNGGLIKPKNGLGGLGGDFLLPVALSNVYQFKKALPHLDIIGCGGVKSGQDVYKHILAGASLVQIGTTLNREGVSCVNRILNELENEMKKHNFTCLDDFKGKYNEFNARL
tara:strand:- start:1021 stop:1968 length:948 start_codon:yes stop_codon:yes gene_type:complete